MSNVRKKGAPRRAAGVRGGNGANAGPRNNNGTNAVYHNAHNVFNNNARTTRAPNNTINNTNNNANNNNARSTRSASSISSTGSTSSINSTNSALQRRLHAELDRLVDEMEKNPAAMGATSNSNINSNSNIKAPYMSPQYRSAMTGIRSFSPQVVDRERAAAIRKELMDLYQKIASVVAIAGVNPPCLIKNIYLRYVYPNIEDVLNNGIVRKVVPVVGLVFKVPMFVKGLVAIAFAAIRHTLHVKLQRKLSKEQIVGVLTRKRNVANVWRYLTDPTYDMSESLDQLIKEILDVIEYDGLLLIRDELAGLLREYLMMPGESCRRAVRKTT